MNRLESSREGVNVPKVSKAPQAPKWTEEEKAIGEAILNYIDKNIDKASVADVYAQASKAASALGIITGRQTFRDIPPKIKSYLEFVWRMQSPDERIKRNLAQMKVDFNEQMEDPDFRHAKTHPEDELVA